MSKKKQDRDIWDIRYPEFGRPPMTPKTDAEVREEMSGKHLESVNISFRVSYPCAWMSSKEIDAITEAYKAGWSAALEHSPVVRELEEALKDAIERIESEYCSHEPVDPGIAHPRCWAQVQIQALAKLQAARKGEG